MDAIFGYRSFRNEIIWCYKSGGRGKKHFPKKHDVSFGIPNIIKNMFLTTMRLAFHGHQHYARTVLFDEDGRQYQRNFKNGKEYRYYLDKGVLPDDWWIDIQAENPASKKRTGYPTQKPLDLYERFIKASSNEGDIVLDPFAGCATTLVAAERLKRQWIGIDIWDSAKDVVLLRLEQEGLIDEGSDGLHGQLFTKEVHFTTDQPVRTDEGELAAPFLRAKVKVFDAQPENEPCRDVQALLGQHGPLPRLDRAFDDPRYLNWITTRRAQTAD